jgi:hypothetical protein
LADAFFRAGGGLGLKYPNREAISQLGSRYKFAATIQ